MTPLLSDEIVVAAPRERMWAILDDVDALKRVLPGCERLEEEAPHRYRAVMRTKLSFMTLRVTGTAAVDELRPPDHARLEITGRPLGLVGSFTVSVPIDVGEADGGGSRVAYAVHLQVTGRLATFGTPILRGQVKDQVREMVANLERELRADATEAPA